MSVKTKVLAAAAAAARPTFVGLPGLALVER